MKKRTVKLLPLLGLVLMTQTYSKTASIRLIGLDSASSMSAKHNPKNASYIIQVASFRLKSHANNYRNKLEGKTDYPVNLTKSGSYFVVSIGPIVTRQATIATAKKLQHQSSEKQVRRIVHSQPITEMGEQPNSKFSATSEAKNVAAPFSSGPYLSAGVLYGRQSLSSITSQEQISGAVQIDAMNPFKVNSDELGFYIAGGKVWPMNSWQLRTELQYNYHGKLSGSINPAFPPPPLGIPNFDTSFQTSVKAQSAFFNAFFQKLLTNRLSAYAGGGVGLAYTKASSTMAIASPPWPAQDSQSHSSTDFAWQLGLGGIYQITNQAAINLAFMHSDLGKPSYGTFYSHAPSIPGRSVHSKSWEANNLVIGLLYYPDLT